MEAMGAAAIRSFREATSYLERFINYERRPERRYNSDTYDLAAFRRLLGFLGDPQRRVPVVHVAGTKGKGSTSAMIAGIAAGLGLRVGLYTSPHLVDIRERIQVAGKPISGADFARALRRVAGAMETHRAALPFRYRTFFEALTAMAFCHFAEAGVDLAVVEVGLGGRLDCTNVVEPLCSVITRLGRDHTETLGDSLEAIAREKAGVIKPGRPVVLAPQAHPEAERVIEALAAERQASLLKVSEECRVVSARPDRQGTSCVLACGGGSSATLRVPLAGEFQLENARAAWLAGRGAAGELGLPWRAGAAARGLAAVVWPGRLQQISRGGRTFVVDGAHNPESALALAKALRTLYGSSRFCTLVAISRNKDLCGVLRALAPVSERMILTRFGNPRAAGRAELEAAARAAGVPYLWDETLPKALAATPSSADHVLITGSLYLAGEALGLLDAVPWSFSENDRA